MSDRDVLARLLHDIDCNCEPACPDNAPHVWGGMHPVIPQNDQAPTVHHAQADAILAKWRLMPAEATSEDPVTVSVMHEHRFSRTGIGVFACPCGIEP